MGVAQKIMFSSSDRLANFFGISGAQIEHNAIAKSKETFFYKLGHFGINGPGLSKIKYIYHRLSQSNISCIFSKLRQKK